MSMLRSSGAGGGRQVHLAGRGSGLHRSAQYAMGKYHYENVKLIPVIIGMKNRQKYKSA